MLSTDECKEMAWYKAADRGHLELLKKLRGWANELQLNQRSYGMKGYCQKYFLRIQPGTSQQKEATVKY